MIGFPDYLRSRGSFRRRGHRGFRFAAALILFAAGFAGSMGAAWADPKVSAASNIPGSAATAMRPIAIIDREDIALSGAADLSELIAREAYNDFGLRRAQVSGYVVLVNGRRAYLFPPLSTVERIEILGESAAAIHSGGAIAGAINIVLREGIDGTEVAVGVNRPNAPGADLEQGEVLWGGDVGRGHLTVVAGAYAQQEIASRDRDYSRPSWTPGGSFADTAGVSVSGNTLFIPTVVNGDDVTVARPLGTCSGPGFTGELRSPGGLAGTGCGYAYADISWENDRDREREQALFVDFDHPLSEDSDIYFDARIARTSTHSRYAPPVGSFDLDRTDFDNPSEFDALIPNDVTLRGSEVTLNHRFTGHGNRDWLSTIEAHDFTLGVRGRLPVGIGYDAHLRSYRHRNTQRGDTFVSETAIQQAIEDGSYYVQDPHNPPADRAEAHRQAIRESSLRKDAEESTRHTTVGLALDGAAGALPGGKLRWAAGAEIDRQRQHNKVVHSHTFGSGGAVSVEDAIGSGGATYEGERQRMSAFGEVELPPLPGWTVTLAGRRDGYDDVGAAAAHKVSSAYRFGRRFTVRGSWDKGSGPPSLSSMHLAESVGFPRVCDTKTHTDPTTDCDIAQVKQVSGGNPELTPYKAKALSAGAQANLGFLTVSADWFRIELSETEAQMSAQKIVDLEAGGQLPAGADVIRQGGDGTIDTIVNPIVNTGEATVAGVDMQAGARWDAGWADFAADLNWLYITESESRIGGEVQPGDYARHRVHSSLRASRGGITANWSVHAVSGYNNVRETGRYDAWVGHDIALLWHDPLGLKGMTVAGGVLNVADRGPSVDSADPTQADARLDSARGRAFFLRGRMAW